MGRVARGCGGGSDAARAASNARIWVSAVPKRIAAIREPSGDHAGNANAASPAGDRPTEWPEALTIDSEPSLPTAAIEPVEANGPPGRVVLVGRADEAIGD